MQNKNMQNLNMWTAKVKRFSGNMPQESYGKWCGHPGVFKAATRTLLRKVPANHILYQYLTWKETFSHSTGKGQRVKKILQPAAIITQGRVTVDE